MKIHVLGGGPGGLFLALLRKKAYPTDEVHVFERNPPDATFGWGVVFSRRTLEAIEVADPATVERALEQARTWEDVVVRQGDSCIHVGGNTFSGIERLHLLNVLQRRCEEEGVILHFEQTVGSLDAIRDADLVVGADGVHSTARAALHEELSAHAEPRRNLYVWLGTEASFDGLTLTFRRAGDSLFIAHSYRYSPEFSTFIVEVPESTDVAENFSEREVAESLPRLQEVFAPELGGKPLLDKGTRWIRFQWVRCDHWHHGNVVLLGDACHTAHFSIGSGTKLAMEDAIALAAALSDSGSVDEALPLYQERRKPVVDRLQAAAMASLDWFERVDEKLHLPPYEFAMDCMTRSDRLDVERVRRRDPEFVAAWERATSEPAAGGAEGGAGAV